MQCNQLTRLMKDWFLHVQQETMAPARMMQFADKHIKYCGACQQDPDLDEEIEKIREFVIPESKIPKAKRNDENKATPDISPDEENIEEKENGDEDNVDDKVEEEENGNEDNLDGKVEED